MVVRMRRPALIAATAAAALSLVTVALASPADAAPKGNGPAHRHVAVCSKPAPGSGQAGCNAIRDDAVDNNGTVKPAAAAPLPAGLGPQDIQSAYGLPGTGGSGRTIAIVDAYDAPTAAADLATYRSTYGLPACTTATGCFRKVSQTGSTTALPARNGGWAQEISLDLDMASAACPGCKILLVEARSASFADLATAVSYAAKQPGVIAISNSYGGSDSSAYASAYNHPGIAVTASTGDSGYGVQSPASLPGVVAVGGTSLKQDTTTTRGWSESAWSGAGSGCSTVNAKPGYQSGTGCAGKATADVSAVADPATGVAVYDSYAYQGAAGWMVFGGTSAASPIIAGVYAQGGVPAGAQAGSVTWAKAGTTAFNDVSTGTNGSCATALWCTSVKGWDGPTGLGTPNGVSAF
jgi:subtilase family serine protease